MKRYVRASANCGTFTVEIEAKIDTKKVLMREEIVEIQKELRQRLSDTIAKLPHGQIYPHEVVLR